MTPDQLMAWGRKNPEITWGDMSKRIESIWGIGGCSIDPMKNTFYKKYSIGYIDENEKWVPYTKGDILNQFHDDVRHLIVDDVLIWGATRFGVDCFDYKVEFIIRGKK